PRWENDPGKLSTAPDFIESRRLGSHVGYENTEEEKRGCSRLKRYEALVRRLEMSLIYAIDVNGGYNEHVKCRRLGSHVRSENTEEEKRGCSWLKRNEALVRRLEMSLIYAIDVNGGYNEHVKWSNQCIIARVLKCAP
nr:hypothetical protein [Tanacetum cinerariifolium]